MAEGHPEAPEEAEWFWHGGQGKFSIINLQFSDNFQGSIFNYLMIYCLSLEN